MTAYTIFVIFVCVGATVYLTCFWAPEALIR